MTSKIISHPTIKGDQPQQPLAFTQNHRLVAIEGAIGVGKTSLTRLLAQRWGVKGMYEIFEDNPFLTRGFYENTHAEAFNTEVFFLLSRFQQHRELHQNSGLVLSDYSFDKNWIFAEMNLKPQDREIYRQVYERFEPEVRSPDLVVFLQSDIETLLRRIYFRDRAFERSLTPDYLEKLMNAYYRYFSAYSKAPVLHIQTHGLDFVHNSQDFKTIACMIEDRLSGYLQLSLKSL